MAGGLGDVAHGGGRRILLGITFDNSAVRFDVLRRRAYNLRWAEQEEGVIPLTAADMDFPCAPEIVQDLSLIHI